MRKTLRVNSCFKEINITRPSVLLIPVFYTEVIEEEILVPKFLRYGTEMSEAQDLIFTLFVSSDTSTYLSGPVAKLFGS